MQIGNAGCRNSETENKKGSDCLGEDKGGNRIGLKKVETKINFTRSAQRKAIKKNSIAIRKGVQSQEIGRFKGQESTCTQTIGRKGAGTTYFARCAMGK